MMARTSHRAVSGVECVQSNLTLDLAPLADLVAQRVVDLLAAQEGAPSSPWLSVDEAAEYLRCSRQRVYDAVHEGRLQPGRDGRRLLFRRTALDGYLEGA